ncbi:MAG: hypothetical protein KGM24_01750 [Elusimicrobia bacterium]|nr:hypothetical protein [Elusimicrobiota bacterium]
MSALGDFARAYAAHAGLPEPEIGFEAELAARQAPLPLWARLSAGPCALAARWLAPLVFLGRPARFDDLEPANKDALLARLQFARAPLLRGAFLLIKIPVLGACYASRRKGA